ncbi:MAG: aminopeptidase [Oligoflexales bacterium]|nr:aminopeptidase [Oligoflexales bacterium]
MNRFLGTLIGSISTALWICLSGCYTVRIAYEHNNLYNARKKIDDVISDPEVSREKKEKLHIVKKVVAFAADEGFETERAYNYFIDTKSMEISYLLQASKPDRFEFVTFWFPFVGRVPYLGFFDKSELKSEALKLKDKGYDVSTSVVYGFSSLGWFEDPIYSPMLKNSAEDLTHILFHELVHRSIWVKGEVEFNENLAEFLANKLTEKFLSKEGKSDQLKKYLLEIKDDTLFKEWLLSLKEELKNFYDISTQKNQKIEDILEEKKRIIKKYKKERMPSFFSQEFKKMIEQKEWNNATILGASLYFPDSNRFEKAFSCFKGETFAKFIWILRQKLIESGDPFIALDNMCNVAYNRSE